MGDDPTGRRRARVPRRLAAMLLLASVGCEPPGSVPADVPLSWTAAPAFTVGGVDAPEWAAFGEVTAVGFDGAGRLYVLDGQAGRVTVVGGDGVHAGTLGSPGEGPGELRFPGGMVVHPDGAVTILDPGHGGFVVYDAEGAFVDNVPVDPTDPGLPTGRLRLGPDGGIYADGELRPVGEDGDVVASADRPVVRFSDRGEGRTRVVDRAWRPPRPRVGALDPEATGGLRVRLPPILGFHPELHLAPLSDGRVAVVDSFAYRVRLVGPAGSTTVLERPIPPEGVDEGLREAERRRRLDALRTRGERRVVSDRQGRTAPAPSNAVRRLEEARVEAMGFHATVPVIASIGVDARDRIWVARTGPEPGRPGPVDILDPAEGYLGTLEPGLGVPDAFGPDGLAAWVEEDALGAPVVRVGRIREGG